MKMIRLIELDWDTYMTTYKLNYSCKSIIQPHQYATLMHFTTRHWGQLYSLTLVPLVTNSIVTSFVRNSGRSSNFHWACRCPIFGEDRVLIKVVYESPIIIMSMLRWGYWLKSDGLAVTEDTEPIDIKYI